MGDCYQVHHCVICPDHGTALRVYQRIEVAAEQIERGRLGPSGVRWGFWSARVLLVTTTSKWGSYPGFGERITRGLAGVECVTSSDADADDGAPPELTLRKRLGAVRDFFWCGKEPVMAALRAQRAVSVDYGLARPSLRVRGNDNQCALRGS